MFRSVGYRGVPIPGVPFNDAWGVIRTRTAEFSTLQPAPRHGPLRRRMDQARTDGVIGTYKPDAAETVTCMREDLARERCAAGRAGPRRRGRAGRQRQPQYISWSDWQRLDALEVGRGRASGRPRVEFVRVEDMLAALGR